MIFAPGPLIKHNTTQNSGAHHQNRVMHSFINTITEKVLDPSISGLSTPKVIPAARNDPQHNGTGDAAYHAHPSNHSAPILKSLVHFRSGKLALVRVVVAMGVMIGSQDAAVRLPID